MAWLGNGQYLLVACSFGLATGLAIEDTPKTICRRYGHQAAVIDDKLYIDGGWTYSNSPSEDLQPKMNRGLVYSDLKSVRDEMPVQHANLTKNDTIPNVAGGALWADDVNKVFWRFGGEYETTASLAAANLWGYDTFLEQWNTSGQETLIAHGIQSTAWGAAATIDGKGYYYGGYSNKRTSYGWSDDQKASKELIVFNMDDGSMGRLNTWNNDGVAEGALLAIPASKQGMLVYLGGVFFPDDDSVEVALSMDQIRLFDINDGEWHAQNATGDIPPNRRKFCAGAAWLDGTKGFNIYLFGGFGFGQNATGYDDVYILSLPSFTWTKWWSSGTDDYKPKGMTTCNVVNAGSQMLIIGGNNTLNSDACDAKTLGAQHSLNLGPLNKRSNPWDSYHPDLEGYSVPEILASDYANASADGLSIGSALETYFANTPQFLTRTPTRSFSSQTAAPNSTTDSGPPIAAIAGGAVGGGIVVLIVAGLLWWTWAKKRKSTRTDQPQQDLPQPKLTMNELSGNPRPNSNIATVFAMTPGPSENCRQTPHATSNSPPPLTAYPYPAPIYQQHIPTDSQQQIYDTGRNQQLPYPQADNPTEVPTICAHDQPYFLPSTQHRRMSPLTQFVSELPVRGMTPGTHHVHQIQARGDAVHTQSDSERSVDRTRVDSRAQSTQSPASSRWNYQDREF